MDLELDAVQRRLRHAIGTRLAAVARAEDIHAVPVDHSRESPAWSVLLELGAPTFELPVAAGGLDLGLGSAVIVCEQLGRAGLGSPYQGVALAVDAVSSRLHHASRELLAALAEGKLTVTAAGFEGMPPGARLRAAPTGRRWGLWGTVLADVAETDGFFVPVTLVDEVALLLVPRHRDGWVPQRTAVPECVSVSFRGLHFDDEDVAGRLGPWPSGLAGGVLGRARVRQAAYLLGLAEGAHAETVGYARRREQFGHPLLSFQSVAFRLAAGFARLEALQLMLYRAAWLADSGRFFEGAAAEGLALAAETALDVARDGMQVCGARGMTAEAGTQRYYRILQSEAVRMGLPGELWREAALLRLNRRNARLAETGWRPDHPSHSEHQAGTVGEGHELRSVADAKLLL